MKVTLKFLGFLSEIVGCASMEVELPEDTTVKQVIELWWQQFGDTIEKGSLQRQWYPASEYVSIVVNNEMLPQSKVPEVVLKAGDVVSLVPPIVDG